MTRLFECAGCAPSCRLATDGDEIDEPDGCPWPAGERTPLRREAGIVSRVDLAFSGEMAAFALAGRTCCTTRRARHGDRGDGFAVAGAGFRVVQVLCATLSDARDAHRTAGGFAAPEASEADRHVRVHFLAGLPEGA